MASTRKVDQLLNERCPECGSRFAQDRTGRGFRRHLERLPKHKAAGEIVRDNDGNPVMCGGSGQSWDKGNRS